MDGEKSYILAPRGINLGLNVISDFDVPIAIGNHTTLSRIPLGTLVHNIEFQVSIKFLIKLIFSFFYLL